MVQKNHLHSKIRLLLLIVGLFFSINILYTNAENKLTTTDNIVANWKFDEGSGTIAIDDGPNNNNGDINGSTWTTDAISGNALNFDGIDDYVRIPDSETLNTHDGFTIELWLKADSFSGNGGSNGNPLVCKWTIWAEGEYHLTAYTGGCIRFYLADGITQWSTIVSNVLTTNTWHHVAATWDGTNVVIYVDAEIVKTATTPFHQLYTEEHETDYIQIGHDTGGTKWNFDGILDEVRIFNRALDEHEISDIYTGDFTIPTNGIVTTQVISIDSLYVLIGLVSTTFLSIIVKRRRKGF